MPTSPTDLHYTNYRHRWEDGGSSDVTTLRFPSRGFAFAGIDQRDRRVKLSEIAYLRHIKAQARGLTSPQVVACAHLEQDGAVSDFFPGVDAHTETGERLYSANSLIAYTLPTLLGRGWLRYDGEDWSPAIPDSETAWQDRASAVLTLLTHEDRLYLGGKLGRRVTTPVAFDHFDARRDFMPVGQLGFPREFVWRERPRIAFNAPFFLLEHDDYFSHHSALGEAYNLSVCDGAILRPPLYRRAAFFQGADGTWQAGYFSMADITITLPDGTTLVPEGSRLPGLPFALGPPTGSDIVIYTRAWGLTTHGQPLRHTPVDANRVELTVVDTRIVGRKVGGGLDIPQNGLVLSFPSGALPSAAIPDAGLSRVRYKFAHEPHWGIRQAIQAGPLLLREGRTAISEGSLAQEEFCPTPLGADDLADVGVVPTDYPLDIDRTRAGRIGLGVNRAGQLIVVATPGTERGTYRPDLDSAGATLTELAELLSQAGAVDAINLDGGGSTQLFYLGGLTTTPGNRYRIPGLWLERMVPEIGVLW